jgi:hypothetical protein
MRKCLANRNWIYVYEDLHNIQSVKIGRLNIKYEIGFFSDFCDDLIFY